MSPLHPLDWIAVVTYAFGLMTLGLLASRRRLAPVDYFLASRTTTWPTIGLALFATNISSTALVGLTGGAYSIGLAVFNYEWTAVVILVVFCAILLPSIIQARIYTMPEYLERRYDQRVRILFALMTLFLNIAVDSAGVLYSGTLVCRLLVPDWPLWCITAALASCAGIYAIVGGLRSVIYTEAVQAVVLLATTAFVSIAAFRYAGGWHALVSVVAPATMSLIRPASDLTLPWPGLVLGIPLLGFYYWCTNQSIVQRMLSAKNIDQARWGVLFAGLLKLTVLALVVMPGVCALVIFPHLPHADLAYPNLILFLVPQGFIGVIVAAFIAATIVTIASLLNSASTLITMDVARYFRPSMSDVRIVSIGRISTGALLVVAVAWAPQLQRFPSLWQYLQSVLAYVVPPIVAVFLVGMFWRRANAYGAAATLILGSVCGFLFFLINAVMHWTSLHFLYVAPLLTLFDIAMLMFFSARKTSQIPGKFNAMWAHFETMPFEHGMNFWKDYRVQSAVLLGLTAALVITFR